MDASTWWGIGLIAYAVLVLAIAFFKPGPIWRMGKIQGFVKLLGEKGTVIFFVIFALIAAGVGIALLV
ncbi:hypothetical protein [Dehalogenimonas alkenigignens]|uniref:hypothetical protein n=1 Tax=Dehalogenimonas alkenigignens TaxID=1217799 RepID=UPI000D579015|nr:hypothetical protein [Dehalogenimonas alkenigignens]PVV83719.1 hypothetical protein DD509_05680 [Dehalogenimonas alkenigignens]